MTVRHTPGPWHFAAWDGFNGLDGEGNTHTAAPGWGGERVVHDEESVIVCSPGDERGERWEADGRLIAAAPELLTALENLFQSCRVHDPDDLSGEPAMVDAAAAIAKAR